VLRARESPGDDEADRLQIVGDVRHRLGLKETRSTISFLEMLPCRRMTSRTMRRL